MAYRRWQQGRYPADAMVKLPVKGSFSAFPGIERQSRYSQTGDNRIGSALIGIKRGYAIKFYSI